MWGTTGDLTWAAAASALRRAKQAPPPHHRDARAARSCQPGADLLPQGFDGTYWPEGMESTPPRYAIVRAKPAPWGICADFWCAMWCRILAIPGGCGPMPAAGTPPAGSRNLAPWRAPKLPRTGHILRGALLRQRKRTGIACPFLPLSVKDRVKKLPIPWYWDFPAW